MLLLRPANRCCAVVMGCGALGTHGFWRRNATKNGFTVRTRRSSVAVRWQSGSEGLGVHPARLCVLALRCLSKCGYRVLTKDPPCF